MNVKLHANSKYGSIRLISDNKIYGVKAKPANGMQLFVYQLFVCFPYIQGYKGSIVAEVDDDGELVVLVKLLNSNLNHLRDFQCSPEEFFEREIFVKTCKECCAVEKDKPIQPTTES